MDAAPADRSFGSTLLSGEHRARIEVCHGWTATWFVGSEVVLLRHAWSIGRFVEYSFLPSLFGLLFLFFAFLGMGSLRDYRGLSWAAMVLLSFACALVGGWISWWSVLQLFPIEVTLEPGRLARRQGLSSSSGPVSVVLIEPEDNSEGVSTFMVTARSGGDEVRLWQRFHLASSAMTFASLLSVALRVPLRFEEGPDDEVEAARRKCLADVLPRGGPTFPGLGPHQSS